MSSAASNYKEMFEVHDANKEWRRGHARGLVEALTRYHRPKSAIDLGCGKGFFLSALAQAGVEHIAGVDGPWVADMDREVDPSLYTIHNLNEPYTGTRRYDLAASLEVGEHLLPERTDAFVAELTSLSDYVLFSAAIPGQKGVGHINRRWQGDWATRFAAQGYRCFDPFRRRLFGVPDMAPWFMQNLLFFVREGAYVSDLLAEHEIPPEAASYLLPRWHEKRVKFLHNELKAARARIEELTAAQASAAN